MVVLSVIFPVFNNHSVASVTLPAILNQKLPAGLTFEVVAVDDGSSRPTANWLASQDHPALRSVTQLSNSGRAAARNAGVRIARGDVIVFLDSDVLVYDNFLFAHSETLGLLSKNSGAPDISTGVLCDSYLAGGLVDRQRPTVRLGLPHFTTANVAVRRGLLNKLDNAASGPFDAVTFTHYGWEDMDLYMRLRALGAQQKRSSMAFGFHLCRPFYPDYLTAMLSKEADRAAMALRMLKKHPTLGTRLVIQKTLLHRLVWEIFSLGGILNSRTLGPVLGWLADREYNYLAEVIARHTILNPAYARQV